jgi:hypothetical protein
MSPLPRVLPRRGTASNSFIGKNRKTHKPKKPSNASNFKMDYNKAKRSAQNKREVNEYLRSLRGQKLRDI